MIMIATDRLSARRLAAHALFAGLALGPLAACASAPPPSGAALCSYSDLARLKAHKADASAKADSARLLATRTGRIEPVSFAGEAQSNATPAQRALIANAMERTLCNDLSARFEVVAAPDKADLTLKTVVTRIKPTNVGAAALSLAISFVVPAPRLPVGLGGFAAEAEGLGPEGDQAAAMVWSRNADSFSGKRASSIGDAYDLSTRFAHDLSKLLLDANGSADPKAFARGKAGGAACSVYGKRPGVSGAVAGLFGAPPEWTDGKRSNR